jgi:hypothetical protein
MGDSNLTTVQEACSRAIKPFKGVTQPLDCSNGIDPVIAKEINADGAGYDKYNNDPAQYFLQEYGYRVFASWL